jgi:hypothetical protein
LLAVFGALTLWAAGGGVAIGVGDDAGGGVAIGAGTTYIVKAGTHLRNFSVQPKSGDRFCGEPGAVLDGGWSMASAFSGGREGDPGLDHGGELRQRLAGCGHSAQSRASGWVVRNVSASRNGWAGVMAADGIALCIRV